MATKKKLRDLDFRQKKTKKTKKRLHFLVIGIFAVAVLFVFFVMVFDHIFKPVNEGDTLAGRREKMAVKLYFPDQNERFLVGETRFVSKTQVPREKATQIIQALLDGSKTGLVNSFPAGVPLRGVTMEGDTAVINLGRELIDGHPGGSTSEMATVYSLSNSLIANIPTVKKVKLLVEGGEIESIKGHIDTRQPFGYNEEFVAPAARKGG
jgi:hypothetical protein